MDHMRSIFSIYKSATIVSLTLAIIFIVFRSTPDIISGLLIFLFAFTGIFFLDLDIYIYALISQADKSDIQRKILDLVKYKKFLEYFRLSNDYTALQSLDLVFSNSMFQVGLVMIAVYLKFTQGNIYTQVWILSIYINIIYRQLLEYNQTGSLERWFKFYQNKNSPFFYFFYFIILLILFAYIVLF